MLAQNPSNLKTQGASYREFSRRRYRELKTQGTNLRESEIVARVIREWDAMNMTQKGKFAEMRNQPTVMLNVQPLSTPMKGEMKMGKYKTNQKTTGEKKQPKMEMLESSGSEIMPEMQKMEELRVREFDESQTPKQMKSKKIAHKATNYEYIIFYKNVYKKLTKEHPRWSAHQTSTVAQLLWKKRKTMMRKEMKVVKPVRLCKPMSGRMFFRKIKGFSEKQAKYKWTRLPMESRKMWSIEESKPRMEITLRLSQGLSQGTGMSNPLNFINSKMM